MLNNEVIILTAFKIILHGITGTNYNIRILRHLQTAMIAMGVGEGEDLMCFYSIYKYMGLNV